MSAKKGLPSGPPGVMPIMISLDMGQPRFVVPNPAKDVEQMLSQLFQRYDPMTVMQVISQIVPFAMPPTVPESARISELQSKLQQYAEAWQKLQEQACPLATVLRSNSTKTTLLYGGKQIQANTPKGKELQLYPGRTVRITGDTLQILDAIADDDPAGEVASVTRIARPGVAEIDRAGTSRAVSFAGALEEGDRVVLDSTGSVVVSKLGKPPNDHAVTTATGVRWEDIGGLEEAKRQMREAIEGPTRHAGVFARYGKRPMRGVLLYGPPGCGKTMMGKAAATAMAELHGKAAEGAFMYVKGPELLNMYVGNTEAGIRRVFDAARRHHKKHGFPAVIFLDEADAILGKRDERSMGLAQTIVPQFLSEMDGLEESGAMVLLATNLPSSLDPAVIRDGRIDRRIKIGRPGPADARAILLRYLDGKPLVAGVEESTDAAVAAVYDKAHVLYRVRKHSSTGDGLPMTFGHVVSGAILAGIVDRATSRAMAREIDGADEGVSIDDLTNAVHETVRSIADVDMTHEVREFVDGWESEVCSVTRVVGRKAAVVSQAN